MFLSRYTPRAGPGYHVLNDTKVQATISEAHLDGTVKDELKPRFTEKFVRKYMGIRVILFPHLLSPVERHMN
jgi:hypothetical protein